MSWWSEKPMPRIFSIKLYPADDGKHKFTVDIYNNKYHIKRLSFGAEGYGDFTIHNNEEQKKAYIARHEKNEDWTAKGIMTAGFWARWLLWNKPTIEESMADIENKFNIKFL
jgi:hypothetical protein